MSFTDTPDSLPWQGNRPTFAEESDEGPPMLKGVVVDSLPEYYFGKALEAAGYQYGYQWTHYYGTLFPDGAIVDFVVFTRPKHTPVFIDGEYWHAQRQDRDSLQRESLFAVMQGRLAQYIAILDVECDDPDKARDAVSKYFGSQ